MPEKHTRRTAIDIHDELAGWFEAQYAPEPSGHDRAFQYGRRFIAAKLEQVIAGLPPQSDVLDVGCGTGELVADLRERGHRAVGIEPSEKMRQLAAARLPTDVVRDGSVLDLAYPEESFDLVTAIEVFRYLDAEDNVQGMREIHRVLRPGGVFFGTFVNLLAMDSFNVLVAMRRLGDRLGVHRLKCHTQFETPRSLRSKLRQAGFAEVETNGAMFAPLRIVYKLSRRLGDAASAVVRPIDPYLADGRLRKATAGHLIAIARK